MTCTSSSGYLWALLCECKRRAEIVAQLPVRLIYSIMEDAQKHWVMMGGFKTFALTGITVDTWRRCLFYAHAARLEEKLNYCFGRIDSRLLLDVKLTAELAVYTDGRDLNIEIRYTST
jgi:hypothetical protein